MNKSFLFIKTVLFVLIIITLLTLAGCEFEIDDPGGPVPPDGYGSIEGYVTFTSDAGYASAKVKGVENEDNEEDLYIRILPSDSVEEQNEKELKPLSTYSYLNDVKVYVEGPDKTATTDQNGYFRIDSLQQGYYEVAFEHENFKTFFVNAWVYSGQTTLIDKANFPLIHYLVIAIDEYRFTGNLEGSVNSSDYFIEHVYSNNYFQGQGLYYTNEEANKENIKGAIETIGNNMEEDDYFVLYYAGHGVEEYENDILEQYLYVYEGSTAEDDLISTAELNNWLNEYLPNNNVTAVLDASNSGGFIKALDLRTETQVKHSSLNKMAETLSLGQEGYTVITSADEDQISHQVDFDDKKMGILTYFLIEGIKGDYPADENRNGEVSASEWFDYAEPRVINFEYNSPVAYPQLWLGGVDPVIFRYAF